MKYFLTCLLAVGLLAGTVSAQNTPPPSGEGGPTYSGKVVGASDSTGDEKNDTFDIDLDGDGDSDVTVEADGVDGTELVAVGMPVKFKLTKLKKRDDPNDVRKVSEWVEIGSSEDPTP